MGQLLRRLAHASRTKSNHAMAMNNWVDDFRASVMWGDQITECHMPNDPPCCSVWLDDGMHVWVPGELSDLEGAGARAELARRSFDCRGVTVMFLDEQATAAQVEEALHAMAARKAGCDFLGVQPSIHRSGLLLLMSEGTLLDGLQG
jgi:hypothetical protein